MRRPIEKLAWLIDEECEGNERVGAIAERYGESTERIIDAIDVIKIIAGKPTTIPAVNWGER